MKRTILSFFGGVCFGAFVTLGGINNIIDMMRIVMLITGVHITIWAYQNKD